MQCHRAIRHNVCNARHAYNPALALCAFFGTTPGHAEHQRAARSKQPRSDVTTSHNNYTSTSKRKRPFREGLRNRSALWPLSQRQQAQPKQDDLSSAHGPVQNHAPATTNTPSASGFNDYMLKCRELVTKARSSPEELDMQELPRILDYKGIVLKPYSSTAEHSFTIPWAVPASEVRGRSATDILSQEIKTFGEYMAPTPVEQIARQAVVEDAKKVFREALGSEDAKTAIALFGSEKTGLALPFSDIDLRVFDTSGEPKHQPPIRMSNRMNRLRRLMLNNPKFTNIKYRHRFYPILACQHHDSGLTIQFVASGATDGQQEIVARYLAEIPHLKVIFMLIRTFFSTRGLLDTYFGGLGSYGTFISVLAALNRKSPFRGMLSESGSLRQVLAFYRTLDTTKHGVAVNPRTLFKKHDCSSEYDRYSELANKRGDDIRAAQWFLSQRSQLQPYLLCLQDPADPFNDLGRKCHATKHIMATFQYYRDVLWRDLYSFERAQSIGEDWQGSCFLTPLVGRCHEHYHQQRQRLQKYGNSVVEGWQLEPAKPKAGTAATESRQESETASQDHHDHAERAAASRRAS